MGLIGNGGREHAIAKALMKYKERDSLYVFANYHNPGIEKLANDTQIGSFSDIQSTIDYFSNKKVDFVMVGPETPLTLGVVDKLRSVEIPTIGPTVTQAQLESDKSFMREFLNRNAKWGSLQWKVVKSKNEALDFINTVGQIAIKPIGLTGGKGVKVMGTNLESIEEAVSYALEWIDRDGSVLLEERLVGEEFSRIIFAADGEIAPMPVAQDFKYAYDGDKGPMTGGMGVYTMPDGGMPFMPQEDLASADQLMKDVIDAIGEETQTPYRGILYGQFMETAYGPKVIEFNARFGDPEAINEMMLLEGDVPQLFFSIALGMLEPQAVNFKPKASLCKYLVPQEYPEKSVKGLSFTIDEEVINKNNLSIIYASVKKSDSGLETLGSRTMAIAGLDEKIYQLSDKIENFLKEIEPLQFRHRHDIGSKAVIEKRIQHMKSIRAQFKA